MGNSPKHRDKANTEPSKDMPAQTKDGLISIVDKIKLNLLKEGYWDKEITSDLEKIDSNDSLFDAALPIYNGICVKRNQEKFLRILRTYSQIIYPLQVHKSALCSLVMISSGFI